MALLTYDELSKRLSIPVGTLYSWVSKNQIPYLRLSARVVRFDDEKINKWLGERACAPADAR